MLITRECDYAVRIIRELSDGNIKTVKEICEKELIPSQFAYKILKKLEKGKLTVSFRGVKGGYQIGRSPDKITLYDIFVSVEDILFVNQCLDGTHACPRNPEDAPCQVHKELNRLQDILIEQLKEKNMAEILGE